MTCSRLFAAARSYAGRASFAGLSGALAFCLASAGVMRAEGRSCRSELLPLDADWSFHLGETQPSVAPNATDPGWEQVQLPHDWAIRGARSADNRSGGAGGFAPMGIGWYRRTFVTPKGPCAAKVAVQFDGIMAHSDVWVNGHHLGSRPNGYVTIRYDLTPYLKPEPGAANELLVRADNSEQPSSRFYQGAGLYRHAHLLVLPELHTADWSTFVTTPKAAADEATVKVQTMLVNDGKASVAPKVRITLMDAQTGKAVGRFSSTEQALAAGATRQFETTIRLQHPKLWNLETPHLYRAQVEFSGGDGATAVDEVNFGVREMHFDAATGFWLNGRKLKIKGVALHSDIGALGMAAPLSLVEHRLQAMKNIGANAIRTAHNPVDPGFLDLCDRMGLLVLDEFFDMWTVGKNPYDYHRDFREWYLRDLQETVQRDRNHPSIFAWSAGNEIHDTPHPDVAKPILASMVELYHKLDPTRPVTQALFRPNASHDYDDGLADLLDVIGQNYRPNEILAAHEQKPTRKIMGTENIHDRATWVAVRDNAPYSGMFLWSGTDYLGESRRWPVFAAGSGMDDRTDYPKPDGLERESWWRTEPVVHVVRRTAPTPKAPTDPGYEQQQYRPGPTVFHDWTPEATDAHMEHVEVYSNCARVQLSLNGKEIGTAELPADASARKWEVPYAAGELTARCLDHAGVAEVLRTAGSAAAVHLVVETGQTDVGFDSIAMVRATIVDSSGIAVPRAEIPLRFSVEGPGRVVATDDADTVYHAPFESASRATHDGRAVGYIERTGRGPIRVKVEGDGVAAGVVTLP